jgi:hypothetical protein
VAIAKPAAQPSAPPTEITARSKRTSKRHAARS